MPNLTVAHLFPKLRKFRFDSVIRLHFAIDPDTHQPIEVTLQAEEKTGKVTDLWVWDGFNTRPVEHRHHSSIFDPRSIF